MAAVLATDCTVVTKPVKKKNWNPSHLNSYPILFSNVVWLIGFHFACRVEHCRELTSTHELFVTDTCLGWPVAWKQAGHPTHLSHTFWLGPECLDKLIPLACRCELEFLPVIHVSYRHVCVCVFIASLPMNGRHRIR